MTACACLSRIEAFDLMPPRDLDVLRTAVLEGDSEAVRAEGYHWSGQIGLAILDLADQIDKEQS